MITHRDQKKEFFFADRKLYASAFFFSYSRSQIKIVWLQNLLLFKINMNKGGFYDATLPLFHFFWVSMMMKVRILKL